MDVTLLPGFNPGPFTGAGNNTYLLTGRHPTLIDAGTGESRHLVALDEALAGARLEQVLVTHAHSDHAEGSLAVAAQSPGAVFRKVPWPELDGRYGVSWQPIADGDEIEAGDGRLRVLHTPGHAPDHVCLYDEPTGTLFVADLVVLGSSVVIPASRGGSLTDYLGSLRRVLELAPARMLPAHGEPIDDPRAVLLQYLEHRQRREEQVLTALEAGARTADTIVTRIYPQLATSLLAAARENVLAHLCKLRDDGRVTSDEEEWELVR